jgi:hypothetical protein
VATLILGEEFLTKSDLQRIALLRLSEAKALLSTYFADGAVYLAGYAVECALKACIAGQMRDGHFPPSKDFVSACYVHDVQKLFKTSQLWSDFEVATAATPDLRLNWQVVKGWSERKRYDPKVTTWAEAEEFIKAVEHPAHGVLTWIQTRW